jgi:hypothetical protein
MAIDPDPPDTGDRLVRRRLPAAADVEIDRRHRSRNGDPVDRGRVEEGEDLVEPGDAVAAIPLDRSLDPQPRSVDVERPREGDPADEGIVRRGIATLIPFSMEEGADANVGPIEADVMGALGERVPRQPRLALRAHP